MAFYVYILRCADGSYYVGHTDDLEKRVSEHRAGFIPGYTHTRRPVALVFAAQFPSREQALQRERQIKGWSRAKKEALIKGNWERLRRLTRAFSGDQRVAWRSAQPSERHATPPNSGFAGETASLRLRSGQTGLPAGKLPNEMLARLLRTVTHRDPRVVVGPGIGRDAAVIDTGGPRLLIAKSDPITFATDLIGWYAVHVNANDVACTGATGDWFLATLLLPDGAAPDLAESIFDQIVQACDSLEIELVGGHTEVTYRLERPIVVGAMLGEVERDRLVRPENSRPGDAVILTKGIAIEGTTVLAREAADTLRGLGVKGPEVEAARKLIFEPGISVLREARAAGSAAPVHALHDPTEGGLATALYELAGACGTGLAVNEGAIEVLPLTRRICEAAGLDPLGLLASGALLVVVAEEDCEPTLFAIAEAGVPAKRIGSLLEPEEGIIIGSNNRWSALPRFERDEVARFLSETGDAHIPSASGGKEVRG